MKIVFRNHDCQARIKSFTADNKVAAKLTHGSVIQCECSLLYQKIPNFLLGDIWRLISEEQLQELKESNKEEREEND